MSTVKAYLVAGAWLYQQGGQQ